MGYKNQVKTPEEVTENIINYFLQNKDNTTATISRVLNYKIHIVNRVITDYLKQKTPK